MAADFAALRARLDAFQFEPSFVRKLAREQDWSLSRAQQACEEYKRFVCLAIAAGHPCAPSDAVDQVWHQHLLHTEDYWGRFCSEVLRAPLHHQPGGNAAGDGDKFRDWYRNTLASYRRCFECAPPAAFWPSPERYLDGNFRRIDRSKAWLLPKPRWPRRLAATLTALRWRSPKQRLALIAASLGVAGCSMIQRVPPFDMAGPSFLRFFVLAWALSLLVVVVMRGMGRGKREHGDVHPYELAYLVDGDWQVVQVVSTALVQDGRLTLSSAQKLAASPSALHDTDAARTRFAPLERAVIQCCLSGGASGASPSELLPKIAERRALLTAALEGKGLLFGAGQRRLFLGLALLAPLLGVVKIGVGIALGRPVGFLVLLTVVASFVALRWFRGEPQLTPAAKGLIAELRRHHSSEQPSTMLADQPVAMSVALFGSAVLAQGAFLELERALANTSPARPAPSMWGSNVSSGDSSDSSWSSNDWSSSSDSSSSSSCSSSSDSGGSSCSSSSSGCGGCSSSSSSD